MISVQILKVGTYYITQQLQLTHTDVGLNVINVNDNLQSPGPSRITGFVMPFPYGLLGLLQGSCGLCWYMKKQLAATRRHR
jgi:hypothetical protein